MCIAILNTANNVIEESILQRCWKINSDGAGMAYANQGGITIFKEMRSFAKFYREYVEVRQALPDANIMLHFRIKTHGSVGKDNTHPFMVNDDLAFCHNGIIDIDTKQFKGDLSDTRAFNELYLKQLPDGFIYNEAIRGLLFARIGYSKLLFLTSKNEFFIVAEKRGEWHDGNWYSNSGYKSYSNAAVCDPRNHGRLGKQQSFFSTDNYEYIGGKWLPKETKQPATSRIIKPESKVQKVVSELNCCEQCDTPLYGRMEQYYGFCDRCLVSAGIKDY